jgi:hypothetical protein
MTHPGDHEEVKVVGNTVARRLLDGGAVVERVLRCDDRIREAVSPSRRGYAAGNLRPVLLVQSRPTSPAMLVHLFETREEAETWMAAW